MIILLTNDDGIEAEGLQALRTAVESHLPGAEIYTVAPAGAMSQVGHKVTTAEAIRVDTHGQRSWAAHGTPADCVRLALCSLLPKRPDWVLSGINHGGNMGQDIYISGTVAAVREGTYHGVPGIAFSQYMRRGRPLDWTLTSKRLEGLLADLLEHSLQAGEHLNVNFPHVEEPEADLEASSTHPEPAPLPVNYTASDQGYRYSGDYGSRPRDKGSDVHACFSGKISVTKLTLH